MPTAHRETIYISISAAVRQTGVSRQVVQECISRRLVRQPLTEGELEELRRIRRLRELGVNLQGIEIILHMRRRILDLQAELRRQGSPVEAESEQDGIWHRRLPWYTDWE